MKLRNTKVSSRQPNGGVNKGPPRDPETPYVCSEDMAAECGGSGELVFWGAKTVVVTVAVECSVSMESTE